jgi:hypothetical protein
LCTKKPSVTNQIFAVVFSNTTGGTILFTSKIPKRQKFDVVFDGAVVTPEDENVKKADKNDFG